jgi:hypothetical protein
MKPPCFGAFLERVFCAISEVVGPGAHFSRPRGARRRMRPQLRRNRNGVVSDISCRGLGPQRTAFGFRRAVRAANDAHAIRALHEGGRERENQVVRLGE